MGKDLTDFLLNSTSCQKVSFLNNNGNNLSFNKYINIKSRYSAMKFGFTFLAI